MNTRARLGQTVVGCGILLIGLLLSVGGGLAPTAQATGTSQVVATPTSQLFPETSKSVGGLFLAYWSEHGELAQQGYPISEEMTESSTLDPGKSYRMQYFERAVFEHHPENAGTKFEVLLTQLGTYRYQAKYGTAGAPGQQASTANPRFFPETGKILGGKFREYWENHGQLAQQGYPISDEFIEVSDLDPGKSYRVQYFERAVFEYHPEYAGTPAEVLLAQLGTYRYRDLYLQPPSPPQAVMTATPQASATPEPQGLERLPYLEFKPESNPNVRLLVRVPKLDANGIIANAALADHIGENGPSGAEAYYQALLKVFGYPNVQVNGTVVSGLYLPKAGTGAHGDSYDFRGFSYLNRYVAEPFDMAKGVILQVSDTLEVNDPYAVRRGNSQYPTYFFVKEGQLYLVFKYANNPIGDPTTAAVMAGGFGAEIQLLKAIQSGEWQANQQQNPSPNQLEFNNFYGKGLDGKPYPLDPDINKNQFRTPDAKYSAFAYP